MIKTNYYIIITSGYGGGRGGGRGGGGGGGGKFNQPGSSLRKPRWDMDSLPRFDKNFYREHPNVQARTAVSKNLTLANNINKTKHMLW